METAKGREPVRTCVGCRSRFPQRTLVRYVRANVDGNPGWERDAAGRRPGRGVYLCSVACALRVSKNRRYPGLASAAKDWA